jgi:hypothetical protein
VSRSRRFTLKHETHPFCWAGRQWVYDKYRGFTLKCESPPFEPVEGNHVSRSRRLTLKRETHPFAGLAGNGYMTSIGVSRLSMILLRLNQ